MNLLNLVLAAAAGRASWWRCVLPRRHAAGRSAAVALALALVDVRALARPARPASTAAQRASSSPTDVPWIASPDIRYHVGLDGISLWLVLLSTFLTPICVLISWQLHSATA